MAKIEDALKKLNPTELAVYNEIFYRQLAKEIYNLTVHPTFLLRNSFGQIVATYTPEFTYVENGTPIAVEAKGSRFQHSATRSDYKLKVKWFLSENPEFVFYQVEGSPKKGFKWCEFQIKLDKNSHLYLKEIKA